MTERPMINVRPHIPPALSGSQGLPRTQAEVESLAHLRGLTHLNTTCPMCLAFRDGAAWGKNVAIGKISAAIREISEG